MRIMVAVLLLTLLPPATGMAQAPSDSAAIHETVLDYVDGWWTGDAERMASSLHPDLVKRIVVIHEVTGRSLMNSITKSDMVEYTRAGGGSAEIEQKGEVDVQIVSIEGGIANVMATSARYVDYLHVAKWNDSWLIVNVLWAPRSSDGGG